MIRDITIDWEEGKGCTCHSEQLKTLLVILVFIEYLLNATYITVSQKSLRITSE